MEVKYILSVEFRHRTKEGLWKIELPILIGCFDTQDEVITKGNEVISNLNKKGCKITGKFDKADFSLSSVLVYLGKSEKRNGNDLETYVRIKALKVNDYIQVLKTIKTE